LLVRYNPDGTLDSTFGNNGVVQGEIGEVNNLQYYEIFVDSALQTDGKIVTVGWATPNSQTPEFVVRRWNADGSPDSSFGSGGRVFTDFPGAMCASGVPSGCREEGWSVVVQPDGKLVVGGNIGPVGGGTSRFAFARYNADGTLDTSFGLSATSPAIGDGGRITVDVDDGGARWLALQSDGKIVAGGNDSNRVALVRLTSAGSLDTTFGADGVVEDDLPNSSLEHVSGLAIQQNQKIVVSLFATQPNSSAHGFALARYNAVGTPDTTFGNSGVVYTAPVAQEGDSWNMTLDSQARIVVVGREGPVNGPYDYAVYRYE
jgi:uncharacterized delta-60 repeat protein